MRARYDMSLMLGVYGQQSNSDDSFVTPFAGIATEVPLWTPGEADLSFVGELQVVAHEQRLAVVDALRLRYGRVRGDLGILGAVESGDAFVSPWLGFGAAL